MRKNLVIVLICIVSFAVSVSFSLGQTDFSSNFSLDFANSGTPEFIELGFHNSDLPTHVEL